MDERIKQFSVFVIGGVISALIDVIVTAMFLAIGIWYVISISVGFFVGLCVNYVYHSKVTFRRELSRAVAIRFGLIVALNYLLTLSIVIIVCDIAGSTAMIGKVLSLPIVAAHGYMWSRYWIFNVE